MLLETLARQKVVENEEMGPLLLECILPSVGTVFSSKHTFLNCHSVNTLLFSYWSCQLIQTGHKPSFLEVGWAVRTWWLDVIVHSCRSGFPVFACTQDVALERHFFVLFVWVFLCTYYLAPAGLELTKLTSDSQRCACLSSLGTGVKDTAHHACQPSLHLSLSLYSSCG